MKKLFLIPGYAESTRGKNYRGIIKVARELGFKIVHVNISWDTEKVMDDYIWRSTRNKGYGEIRQIAREHFHANLNYIDNLYNSITIIFGYFQKRGD